MAAVTEQSVLEVLASVNDPARGKDVVSLGMIAGVQTRDGHVVISVEIDPARIDNINIKMKLHLLTIL